MTVNAPRMRIAGPRRARSARSRFGISRARLTASDAHATRRTTAAAAVFAVALGALFEYFLDPDAGRRRRHTTRDRIIAKLRRSERRAVSRARRAESRTVGLLRRTLNARQAPKPPADDVALAHKVETELFRRARVPKGRIDVNAEDGTVFLRGVVERQEDIARVEAVAQRIAGVRRVENLLHLPRTPAPASPAQARARPRPVTRSGARSPRARRERHQTPSGQFRRVHEARGEVANHTRAANWARRRRASSDLRLHL